jgi:hypothetical protein
MHKLAHRFLASSVGNAMEMFDFAIFGALADIIGEELFTPDTSKGALLKGLGKHNWTFINVDKCI